MTAKLFMNSNPTTLRPTDTIGIAAAKIMEEHLRCLPVVDENGRFLGVISVSCLLFLVLPKIATMQQEKYPLDSMPYVTSSMDDLRRRLKKAIDYPITICLKEGVKVVHPDTPIVETLLTLYKTKANLPVVERESGRLAGMISYYDVGDEIMKEAF